MLYSNISVVKILFLFVFSNRPRILGFTFKPESSNSITVTSIFQLWALFQFIIRCWFHHCRCHHQNCNQTYFSVNVVSKGSKKVFHFWFIWFEKSQVNPECMTSELTLSSSCQSNLVINIYQPMLTFGHMTIFFFFSQKNWKCIIGQVINNCHTAFICVGLQQNKC